MTHEARVFSLKEYVKIMNSASRVLVKRKKKRLITKQMKERLMLAVTKVNGCSLCSFVHTKIALSTGMTNEEIKLILDGEYKEISDDELLAVLYAEHYADTHEAPDEDFNHKILEYYGKEKCEGIKCICCVITMTNALGITMDHFWQRITFRRNKDSNLLTEIGIILSTFTLLPLFLLKNKFE